MLLIESSRDETMLVVYTYNKSSNDTHIKMFIYKDNHTINLI